MPRNTSDIYFVLPGTEGFPDTTIESEKYNSYIHDVETDLNLPRPILAGGTGATNASDARRKLGAEQTGQIIANYDADMFFPGSFYSAASATSSPVSGHAFAGICYSSDPPVLPPGVPTNTNLVIEARDQNDTIVPGRVYVREKKTGVWGIWTAQANAIDLDATYVNVAGDTMTGDLVITLFLASAGLTLNNTGAGTHAAITGQKTGVSRWVMELGNATLESGADVGSDFALSSFDNSGSYLRTPLTIPRSKTAPIAVDGSLVTNGNVAANTSVFTGYGTTNTGAVYFGSDGSRSLGCDGTNYVFAGGAVWAPQYVATSGLYYFNDKGSNVLGFNGSNYILQGGGNFIYTGNIVSQASATQGTYYFGSNFTKYLYYDGANFNLVGGPLTSLSTITAVSLTSNNPSSDSGVNFAYTGTVQGAAFWQKSTNSVRLISIGGGQIYVDASPAFVSTVAPFCPGGGPWNNVSDARIKTVKGDYTLGLDAVAALRPVTYSYKGNDTPTEDTSSSVFADAKSDVAPYPASPHYLVAKEGKQYVGLVAQDVETTFPGMVVSKPGYIDGEPVPDQRDLNTGELIFALVNAIKELKARIEVLEGA